ncbi:MAG: hypothetical protein IJO94_06505 [Firmicutes bacterium]|nr:hypothetical protein [Bacillota bacterium]
MIEIKKVTDPLILDRISKDHQIKIECSDHVIATIEREKILHCAVFSYEDEIGKIKAISGFEGDMDLLDGLCRAILNIMDINGVKQVYLSNKYAKLAEFVGFSKAEGSNYILQLEGFFQCGCCRSKK